MITSFNLKITKQRQNICKTCDKLNYTFEKYLKKLLPKCKVCGCFMHMKWLMEKEICPVGKW